MLLGSLGVGFLLALTLLSSPPSPEARLPRAYRLAALIERQEREVQLLRQEVETSRQAVDDVLRSTAGLEVGASQRQAALDSAMLVAGMRAIQGPGLRVVLDDSVFEAAPNISVNDLVVHSQDVQAVANALWRAGAEAISINGQRLVSTSAVLCVGNTLLLNGSVHSPPYVFSAVGAVRDRFDTDPLVEQLRDATRLFGLRFDVQRQADLEVPPYRGGLNLRYARPAA